MKRAFSLIELAIVIAVVAILSAVAVPRVGAIFAKAKTTAAEKDLAMLREAMVDPERGLLHDVGYFPGFDPSALRLVDLMLFTNRFERWESERGRGWRGPYVRSNGDFPGYEAQRQAGLLWRGRQTYGNAGELAVLDPWGMPYVLQIPDDSRHPDATSRERFRFARFVSLGPNRRLDTPYDRFTNLHERIDAEYDDFVTYLVDPDVPEKR